MITDTFTLKRDTAAENAAVEGIISLFTDKWEETSKKSSREITALVLTQIKDACIVVPKGEETEESTKLKHANSFFEKTIEQLKSNGPLPIVISGNNGYDDIISNLQNISSAANGDEHGVEIKERIGFFIDKISKTVEQMQAQYQNVKKGILIKSVFFGLLFAGIMALIINVGVGSDFSITTFLFCWCAGIILSYVVLNARLNGR